LCNPRERLTPTKRLACFASLEAAKAGAMASSKGRPKVTPAPRSSARLERCFLKMKVLMGMIAKKRKYTKKSDIGVELIKAYSQNGVPVKEIKNKLLENGISLSLKSIYKYVV
jgi:hypothetical protein